MLWEAVFMLVILKIPVVYLCMVVWWAIRAEPAAPEEPALVPVEDTPGPSPSGRRPPPPAPRSPRREPRRGDRRGTGARVAAPLRVETRR